MIHSDDFQPRLDTNKHRFTIGLHPCLSVFIRGSLFLFFLTTLCVAQEFVEPETGEAIAQELRTMQPGGNTEISGVLKIRSNDRRIDIPVTSRIITNENSWQMIYETSATTNMPAEKFVIIHSLTGSNKYLYARAATPKDKLPEPKSIEPSQIAIPLASSDFWLSELGFDFLHWPVQRKLPGEMRLGQACYVLESINPTASIVVRVESWIDKDSGGLLIAEGYDRDKKLVKEFSLAGSSFKKVNGNWQLRRMKIRSPKKDSETVLEFDLPREN